MKARQQKLQQAALKENWQLVSAQQHRQSAVADKISTICTVPPEPIGEGSGVGVDEVEVGVLEQLEHEGASSKAGCRGGVG